MLQVEREKRKAAAQAAAEYQKASENQGWLSWVWGGAPKAPTAGGGDADERADLTDEEYQKLEDIVAEREEAVKQSEAPSHAWARNAPSRDPERPASSLSQPACRSDQPNRYLLAISNRQLPSSYLQSYPLQAIGLICSPDWQHTYPLGFHRF